MKLVTAIALLAFARGASAAAGDFPACPTAATSCSCPAGMEGGYPACRFAAATSRTGATSTATDVCAPTIEDHSGTKTHVYHMMVKFDSTTPTPQYVFHECQSAQGVYVEHPTIMMQAGTAPVEYRFDQTDESNWFHPVGFAYKYDGAHVEDATNPTVDGGTGNPELGDNDAADVVYYTGGGGTLGTSAAAGDGSAVKGGTTKYKYYKDDHDLSTSKPDSAWHGSAWVGGKMGDDEGNGLDSYEPQFFFSQDFYKEHTWHAILEIAATADSSLSAADNTPVTDGTVKDFFYFCHIHGGMSGRIKVVAGTDATKDKATAVTFLNGENDSKAGTPKFFPATDVEYYHPDGAATGLDLQCGTNGIDEYSSSKTEPKCHDTFVCDIGDNAYGKCLDAMDCYMATHMRTALHEKPVVNFFEQMIPHHINAVNMAKATLKTLTDADDSDLDADLKSTLWNIINVQSQQVQYFEGALEAARGAGVAKTACAGLDHSVSGSTAAFPASATAVSAVAVAGAAFVSSFGEL